MYTINCRNVHEGLVKGLDYLFRHGVQRGSRNGPVFQSPEPVTTVYEYPLERVVFWPERDANPFFHLYESLWMLAGRNDVGPLLPYAQNMAAFSDDGVTLHGAYGCRWRKWFSQEYMGANKVPLDQLAVIGEALRKNNEDRRCVLQMWDVETDLGRSGKDVPCNTMATFQVSTSGRLDLVVFNRSNDIVWGAYGANAVHMAFLLEYMALITGYPVGTYSQVSVNYHGYLNTMEPLRGLMENFRPLYSVSQTIDNPYTKDVETLTLAAEGLVWSQADLDHQIKWLLSDEAHGFPRDASTVRWPPFQVIRDVLAAHHIYKTYSKPQNFISALAMLDEANEGHGDVDWVRAAREWILRRYAKYKTRTLTPKDAQTEELNSFREP